MSDGMNEIEIQFSKIIDKAELRILGDRFRTVERALESLFYRNKPLTINNMTIPVNKIRKDLEDLSHSHVEIALSIFDEQCAVQKINNKISYLATCIYNTLFDMELKIQNDLRYDGLI